MKTEAKRKAAAFASRPFLCLVLLLAVDQFVLVDDPAERTVVSWLGIAAGAIPLASLLFSPLALGQRLARFVLAPAAVWLALHGALQLYLRHAFGMFLDGDWIGILRASSLAEIRFFLADFGLVGFCGLFAAVFAAGFCGVDVFRGLRNLERAGSCRLRTVGLFSLLAFAVCSPFFGGPFALCEKLGAVGFVTDSIRCARLYGRLEEIAKSPRFQQLPEMGDDMRDVAGVFVLGESSARSHWSLYGYGRDTTAPLDAMAGELIVFSNVTAAASETSAAMRKMFVADGYTLTQLFAASGARTALISNHERWGQWGGIESYVFAGAKQVFLQEEGLAVPCYDDALLPYLRRELEAANGGSSLTVLHLIGSHCPPSRRYPRSAAAYVPEPLPGAFARWRLRDQLNHYDNTIRFTAKTLADAIAVLKARGGAAYLIFVSDHGESPDSDRWRDVRSRDVWEVPALIWLSREYIARFPEKVCRFRDLAARPLTAAEFSWLTAN